jgi:hypothetical protein
MAEVYVYSTLTRDQRYTNYVPGGGDLPIAAGSVLIKGGANLIDKHFVTSRGAMTKINDAEYAILLENKDFLRHRENGFIYVEEKPSSRPTDVNIVVDDMTGRDESAPLVPEDFDSESENNKPPVVNKRK